MIYKNKNKNILFLPYWKLKTFICIHHKFGIATQSDVKLQAELKNKNSRLMQTLIKICYHSYNVFSNKLSNDRLTLL